MQNTKLEEQARWLMDQVGALGRQGGLRDPLNNLLEKSRMTPAQLHGVMWIGRDGALTMGELARRVGVSTKTVTGIVDRLERGGFAARLRRSADRRVVRVGLTAKGRLTFRTVQRQALAKMCVLLRLLEPEERDVLFRLVERLVAQDALGEVKRKDGPCKR